MGCQSVVTQVSLAVIIDGIAEFAPDITRMLHKNKEDDK
jgi:hypothetical protein